MFGNESSVGIPMFESGWRTAENMIVQHSYNIHNTNCDTSLLPFEQILFPEEQSTDYSKAGTTPRLVSSKSLGITDLVSSIVNFFTIIEADRF
eukprot:scaffold34877_cov300-Skeletonema_dohrnii-CCMP3373.AAC.1